jgi:hypothetical protein
LRIHRPEFLSQSVHIHIERNLSRYNLIEKRGVSERKEEILKAVIEAAKKYADKNTGIVKFENKMMLIVGKK